MSRPLLILVRHGESEWNADGRLVGRADPPLTALGLRQAEAAGHQLAIERAASCPEGRPARPVEVRTSPLSRARVTAEVLAHALGCPGEVIVDEGLVELDYGSLDGLRLSEVGQDRWAAWRADPTWRPPGGESLAEVHDRVGRLCEKAAAEIAERDRDVVAVSHVSPIKAAVGWALSAGPEIAWHLSLGVATISRLATAPKGLVSFGEASHLTVLG